MFMKYSQDTPTCDSLMMCIMKQAFDADYDVHRIDRGTYFDELKQQMDEQVTVDLYVHVIHDMRHSRGVDMIL